MMLKFMEIKSQNPKLKQSEIAKEFRCSSSTLQQYRSDLRILPQYRTPPGTANKRRQRFQTVNMTSKDLKWPQMT